MRSSLTITARCSRVTGAGWAMAIPFDPSRTTVWEALLTFARLERQVGGARSSARRRRKVARGDYAGGAPAFGLRVEAHGSLPRRPNRPHSSASVSCVGLGRACGPSRASSTRRATGPNAPSVGTRRAFAGSSRAWRSRNSPQWWGAGASPPSSEVSAPITPPSRCSGPSPRSSPRLAAKTASLRVDDPDRPRHRHPVIATQRPRSRYQRWLTRPSPLAPRSRSTPASRTPLSCRPPFCPESPRPADLRRGDLRPRGQHHDHRQRRRPQSAVANDCSYGPTADMLTKTSPEAGRSLRSCTRMGRAPEEYANTYRRPPCASAARLTSGAGA